VEGLQRGDGSFRDTSREEIMKSDGVVSFREICEKRKGFESPRVEE
jgi:hypothetical protein